MIPTYPEWLARFPNLSELSVSEILWRTCWQTSVLFLIVALILLVLRERIAPKWRFVLWGIVLCRFVIVITPASSLSVFNVLRYDDSHSNAESPVLRLPNAAPARSLQPTRSSSSRESSDFAQTSETIPKTEHALDALILQPGSRDAEPLAGQGLAEQVSSAPASPLGVVASNEPAWPLGTVGLLTVWMVGCAIYSTRLLVGAWRLRRILQECCVVEDRQLLCRVEEACRKLGIRKVPQVRISPRMISPFATGLLRPYVVLPEVALERLGQLELDCVIAHELAHIRRRDMAVQWLIVSIRTVYWFHPICWLTGRQMQVCRESACDDLVLQHSPVSARHRYGETLLTLAQELDPPVLAPGLCGFFGATRPVRYRIQRVLTGRTPATRPSYLAICLVGVFAMLGLTDARQSVAQPTQQDESAPTSGTDSPGEKAQLLKRGRVPDSNDFQVAGSCLSALDQKPISGVRLVLFEVIGLTEQVSQIAETVSDDQGKFRFENLPRFSEHRLRRRHYAVVAHAEGRPSGYVRKLYSANDASEMMLFLQEGSASIKGRVVDARGEPVEGAIVQWSHMLRADQVGTSFFETGADGLFLLSGIPRVGTTRNEARKAYIRIFHHDFMDETYQRPNLDFSTYTLKTASEIRGTVEVAETGKPLAGALVSAKPTGAGKGRKAEARTDENGEYRIIVPEGFYDVMLEDDDRYVAQAHQVECRAGSLAVADPLRAQEGGWIIGRFINTETGKPVVFSETREGNANRVGIGNFGPARPRGKLLTAHWLSEVDDDGYFKIRAMPGENFPYVCNMRGSRMMWDTMKQAAVVVREGEVTECELTYTPPQTPAQKMAIAQKVVDALPVAPDARVAAIIAEFRKLNHTVDECETWCSLMRELDKIGKPAVPALCAEFESTDEQFMMRRLAFALRMLGDPRAVPTLIRVLPKTLQPPMSDYGLLVDDPELTEFMQDHSAEGGRRGTHFSFGRPVRETLSALETLTQHSISDFGLASMARKKDLRALAKQEEIYYRATQTWAEWWRTNASRFKVEAPYDKVDLPPFVARDLTDYPTGFSVTDNAELGSGSSGHVLTPVGDKARKADFFLDLDTEKESSWPGHLPADDTSDKTIAQARAWGAEKGFDLMCEAVPTEDGNVQYTLVGIGLQLWEIDRFDAAKIESFLKEGELPPGRKLQEPYLVHLDPKSGERFAQLNTSFLFLTREDGLGLITVTDFVTKAQNISGMFGAPKGVGFNRGVRFDFHSIVR